MSNIVVMATCSRILPDQKMGEEQLQYILVTCQDGTTIYGLGDQFKALFQESNTPEIWKTYCQSPDHPVTLKECVDKPDIASQAFKDLYNKNVTDVGIWWLGYDVPLIFRTFLDANQDVNVKLADPRVDPNQWGVRYKEAEKIRDGIPIHPKYWQPQLEVVGSPTRFHGLVSLYAKQEKEQLKNQSLQQIKSYSLPKVLHTHGIITPIDNHPEMRSELKSMDWYIEIQEKRPVHYLAHEVCYNRALFELTQLLGLLPPPQ